MKFKFLIISFVLSAILFITGLFFISNATSYANNHTFDSNVRVVPLIGLVADDFESSRNIYTIIQDRRLTGFILVESGLVGLVVCGIGLYKKMENNN